MKEGEDVRSTIVIVEVCLGMSQFFVVDQLLSLSSNVVKCSSMLIFDIINPYFSEVNE